MGLPAGLLRSPITIQARQSGQDAAGQPTGAWAAVCTTWADIVAPSGRATAERVAADRSTAPVAYSVRIRWRAGITPAMRVLCSVQGSPLVLDIVQVVPDLARREYTDLVCVLGVQ